MMVAGKVLSFGEILLRASPSANGSWLSENTLPIYLGGAECNVAHALALWGVPVRYFSAMPDNYMSASIRRYLETKKIDASAIELCGERIGIYFLEQGADLKNRGVIYDRAHSSFAGLKPGTVDWEKVLENVSWFHFSAISPALNEDAIAVCKEVLQKATERGITISVDLNYRAKLWKYGKKPSDVMPELTAYADVVMGNIWAANNMLGTPLNHSLIEKDKKEAYLEHAAESSEAIIAAFPRCKTVANTFRFTGGEKVSYYASLHHQGKSYASATFSSTQVVDTVGSGDCFMAGLIYGLSGDKSPQEIIHFSAAAAFGKLHVVGDTTTQTVSEIHKIIPSHA